MRLVPWQSAPTGIGQLRHHRNVRKFHESPPDLQQRNLMADALPDCQLKSTCSDDAL